MSDAEEQQTAVNVTQPKRALPGTGSIMTSLSRAILTARGFGNPDKENGQPV